MFITDLSVHSCLKSEVRFRFHYPTCRVRVTQLQRTNSWLVRSRGKEYRLINLMMPPVKKELISKTKIFCTSKTDYRIELKGVKHNFNGLLCVNNAIFNMYDLSEREEHFEHDTAEKRYQILWLRGSIFKTENTEWYMFLIIDRTLLFIPIVFFWNPYFISSLGLHFRFIYFYWCAQVPKPLI